MYTVPVTTVVPSEANLRNQLAARLDLIEYGLHDPKIEYNLSNKDGTRGRVDILARERHGRLVVIEVKRSKKATREALHEVGKYMELLSRAEGYASDRIRAIIASTIWDELSVPFSEAVRRSEQRLDGYRLICDGSGQLIDAQREQPLRQLHQYGMAYGHVLFRFRTEKSRELGWHTLVRRAAEVGAGNVIGVRLDHNHAGLGRLARPYMLYLVIGDADPDHPHPEQFRALVGPAPSRTDIQIDWDVDKRTIEERLRDNIRAWLMLAGIDSKASAELASREMFARLVSPQSDWRITQVLPRGIFGNRVEGYGDESDLIAEIAGWNLRSPSHFIGSASSNDATKWRDYRTRIDEALCGMESWRRIIAVWLGSVGEELPGADIESHIFPSGDLLYALIRGWPLDVDRYLPSLHVTAIQDHIKCARVGCVPLWDGTVFSDLIQRVSTIYPTPADWLQSRLTGTVVQANMALLEALHLSWHLVEENVETRLLTVEKIAGSACHVRLVRNPMPDPNSMLTIWDFFSEHTEQVSALVQHYTSGIQ